MFNDTLVRIYTSSDWGGYMKSIYADVQPYFKKIVFGDDFEIDITNRLFCDNSIKINAGSYVETDNEKYKVIDLKKRDKYTEVYLYKLQRQM
jgi:hypothetical protein